MGQTKGEFIETKIEQNNRGWETNRTLRGQNRRTGTGKDMGRQVEINDRIGNDETNRSKYKDKRGATSNKQQFNNLLCTSFINDKRKKSVGGGDFSATAYFHTKLTYNDYLILSSYILFVNCFIPVDLPAHCFSLLEGPEGYFTKQD